MQCDRLDCTRVRRVKFQTEKLEAANEEFIGLKESYEEAQKSVVDEILQISSELN